MRSFPFRLPDATAAFLLSGPQATHHSERAQAGSLGAFPATPAQESPRAALVGTISPCTALGQAVGARLMTWDSPTSCGDLSLWCAQGPMAPT